MTPEVALALRLAHDVAKYVARIARNVEPDAIPEGLVDMLLDDVYRTDGESSARALAARRAREAGAAWEALPAAARDALDALDALEPRARAREPEALAAVARHARATDDALRAWVRALADLRDPGDEEGGR